MSPAHDPAPPAMRAGGVSRIAQQTTHDADAATASRIAAPQNMVADDRQQRWAATPAIEPTPVRVSPRVWRMITTAVTRRDGTDSPAILQASRRGVDGRLEATAITHDGGCAKSHRTAIVALRTACPTADVMRRLVAVPVCGPLHPLARDAAGIDSVEAADALDALVAEHEVEAAWFLPRAAFRAWVATYGSALVSCDEVTEPLRRLVREDALANGFRLIDVAEQPYEVRVRSGRFEIESGRVGFMPFDFLAPTCTVCGAPAVIVAARFDAVRSGDDNSDIYLVCLRCTADDAHTKTDEIYEENSLDARYGTFDVRRERFVFISAEVRAEAGRVAANRVPPAPNVNVVRDIATGVARIDADPAPGFDVECDPTGVWMLVYNGENQYMAEIDGGIDGWLDIPGHPEILALLTEDWYGKRGAGGDEAFAELRALLPGVTMKSGADANRRAALDAMAALDPATLTAWAERWVGERGAFLTTESIGQTALWSACQWLERLHGFAPVVEGCYHDYDRLLAESVAAGRCLVIAEDGTVTVTAPYGGA